MADVNFDGYAANYPLKRTVERALQIVSEAVKALPDDLLDRYPTPDWERIRSRGNFLRHEYHHIDLDQLWLIATKKLPELSPIVSAMIVDLERL